MFAKSYKKVSNCIGESLIKHTVDGGDGAVNRFTYAQIFGIFLSPSMY